MDLSKFILLIFPFVVLSSGMAKAETVDNNHYQIKPSDVVIPKGTKIGQYERTIRPFLNNWVLVCDLNRSTHKKVCNVTQKIINGIGTNIFSWSLAGSQTGQPVMILRVPPNGESGDTIYIDMPDKGFPVITSIQGCTQIVCVAYFVPDSRFRKAIEEGAGVKVNFSIGKPKKEYHIPLSLSGLKQAIGAI